MECKKCNTEIPSHFEFVISQNVCPKCGNRLMADGAMKIYIDLKKRLGESVEFVMDKGVVCERVAMFVVSNYQIAGLSDEPITQVVDTQINNAKFDLLKQQLSTIDKEPDLSAEEIRAQEAARAEEIADARAMGMDVGELDDDEELVSGKVNASRMERLKRLAPHGKSGGIVRRSE